jgi:hypothetical protein
MRRWGRGWFNTNTNTNTNTNCSGGADRNISYSG